MKNISIHILYTACLCCTLAATSCQGLEDTYKEFAGDEIRYIGKCNDLTVSPGWERIIVKWTNSSDPIIDKVKLKWEGDNVKDSVLLERGTQEYSIGNLQDATYKVTICTEDKDGEKSLESSSYCRPYTLNHEEVASFTRIISKHFFIGDRLALEFAGWQDGIESAILKYTTTDGEETEVALNKSIASSNIYLLDDEIDTTKPVVLYRKGRLTGCDDVIDFPAYELTLDKTYSSDFKEFLKKKYGTDSDVLNADGEVKDSWAKSLKTLELDTDLSSFEDILNFPNLTKLVLGKNRYLTKAGAEDTERGQYTVYNTALSEEVLDAMSELTGLTVERYNNHYNNVWPFECEIEDMGSPEMPQHEYIDLKNAKTTLNPEDSKDYNSHLSYLTDGNASTCWEPLTTTSQTTYTITYDLGTAQKARGIKLVQKTLSDGDQNKDILPQMVKVETAGGDGSFSTATFVDDYYIGRTTGETVFVPFAATKDVRFLRITLQSMPFHTFYQVALAELGLYK